MALLTRGTPDSRSESSGSRTVGELGDQAGGPDGGCERVLTRRGVRLIFAGWSLQHGLSGRKRRCFKGHRESLLLIVDRGLVPRAAPPSGHRLVAFVVPQVHGKPINVTSAAHPAGLAPAIRVHAEHGLEGVGKVLTNPWDEC